VSAAFVDESSNFHPYECDGPGACLHCDRMQRTSLMTGDVLHDPATCALCDPEYDGQPNVYQEANVG
jgi:hypothetical protein